jgi:hypothetical protein
MIQITGNLCEICGGKSNTGQISFHLDLLQFPLSDVIPPMLHTHVLSSSVEAIGSAHLQRRHVSHIKLRVKKLLVYEYILMYLRGKHSEYLKSHV